MRFLSEHARSGIAAAWLCFSSLVWTAALAAPPPPPPAWLYRVDTRPPFQIFDEGFQARGQNDNLAEHFLSISYFMETSAFVATTSSFNSALVFADGVLSYTPSASVVYLYAIRADSTFYNVSASIAHHVSAIEATSGSDNRLPYYLQRLARAQADFSWEHEWITLGAIPPVNIAWAASVVRSASPFPGSTALVGVSFMGPNADNYLPDYTRANYVVFPILPPDNDYQDDDWSDLLDGNLFDAINSTSGNDTFALEVAGGWMHPQNFSACRNAGDGHDKARKRSTQAELCPVINLSALYRRIALFHILL